MPAATPQSENAAPTVTRRLPAEDIRIGSYVTVVQQVTEVISCLWCGETAAADRAQPVLYRHTPDDSGEPKKVLAVCLPFVFVEDLHGTPSTIDLRYAELTLLSPEYIEVVQRKLRKARSRFLKSLRQRTGKKSSKRRKK